MPSEVEASPDTVTSDVTLTLRSSRRPSVHGSGPDRLSPHRQPAMTSTREGRVDDWLIPRSALLEHLLSRARGCAGWRVQRLRALARRFRAHRGLPARLRRPFSLKDRLTPHPRDGESDPLRPRCLPCWETPRGAAGPGPANRTRTLAPVRVGRYPQDVPSLWKRGPRLISSCVVPCSDGAGARARAGY